MTESTATGGALPARIHSITLGIEDLERAVAFYRDGLGLPTHGITGTQYAGDDEAPAGAIAMFHLEDGLVLSLYPRTEMAKDAGVGAGAVSGCGAVVGHFVSRRGDVDRMLELAARAGARVPGPAHERPWGIYSGYFADPDGHLWEVICVNGDGDQAPAVTRSDDTAQARSRHVSVHVARPWRQVYEFAAEPGNLAAWASGLGSSFEIAEGRLIADSSMGRVAVTFTPRNELGVLDHVVTLPSGETVHNPMRVMPDGDECEILFTVRRRPGMTDEQFADDGETVRSDLETLRRLLER